MIDIKTKIHDKYSIEFKVGFSGRRTIRENNFTINSWIFVPNSLDINRSTYTKDQFYKDVKSNIRLITPVFLLRDIADNKAVPYNNLRNSFVKAASSPTRTNIADYEFQLKMFGSIFKSSVRDTTSYICGKPANEIKTIGKDYAKNICNILDRFRDLWSIIDVPTMSSEAKNKFLFTDEYISHVVEFYTVKIIDDIDKSCNAELEDVRDTLVDMLIKEHQYKIEKEYSCTIIGNNKNNRELVRRHGLLKKYIESALYLKVNTKQDSRAIEQISFSLAAGLAMIVSTLIVIPFQKHLGNYPALIFIILIMAYMLKDRLKDLTRMSFAHKLKDKYFDNRNIISIKDNVIGWEKEGMDFIADEKVPREVLKLRNRSALESDNDLLEEKIILYRKRVFINNAKLRGNYSYDFTGINDIMRFHINHYTQKMDNPSVTITSINDDRTLQTIDSQKIYTLHFVLQFCYEDQLEYKAFKINATRDGIIEIKAV